MSEAASRWKLLRKALLAGADVDKSEGSVSVRRHAGFGLLEREEIGPEAGFVVHVDGTPLLEQVDALFALLDFAGPGCVVGLSSASSGVALRKLCGELDASDRGLGRCVRFEEAGESESAIATIRTCIPDGFNDKLPLERLVRCFARQRYRCGGSRFDVFERVRSRPTAAALRGGGVGAVDNTGNVGMWPTEEALAHYLLGRAHRLAELGCGRACELGAGMLPLAGLALAAASPATTHVVLTDGNTEAFRTLVANAAIAASTLVAGTVADGRAGAGGSAATSHLGARISCQLLKWDREDEHVRERVGGACDLVFGSDCLFFEAFHEDLARTVARLLSERGLCLMAAPRRGRSLERFVACAEGLGLGTAVVERWDEALWGRHEEQLRAGEGSYNPAIHYPLLVAVARTSEDVGRWMAGLR